MYKSTTFKVLWQHCAWPTSKISWKIWPYFTWFNFEIGILILRSILDRKIQFFSVYKRKFEQYHKATETKNVLRTCFWQKYLLLLVLKDIQDKISIAYFMSVGLAWKSAAKSNEKLVYQKLCITLLILDALYDHKS